MRKDFTSDEPPRAVSEEFKVELAVHSSDVDGLGHVNNIVYVRWIQDVAAAHSRAVGLTHQALVKAGGLFVIRKHEIEYLRPAFLGDQVNLITYVAWWRGATAERATRIVRVSDGALLARATTLWVFVGADNGRPKRVAKPVIDAYMRYSQPPPPPALPGAGRKSAPPKLA